jgi:hypothetical protein
MTVKFHARRQRDAMEAIRERSYTTKWGDLEPEEALIGGVLQQACRDALQTANERLRLEAWEFLEGCAPVVAQKLRKQQGARHGSLA